MKKETAEEICELMLRHGQELDRSVARVLQREGESEEYLRYRRVVGGLMGDMLLKVLNPLYAEHPDLKPPELR